MNLICSLRVKLASSSSIVDAAAVVEGNADGSWVVAERESDVGPFFEEESFSGWNKYKTHLIYIAR